MIYIYPIIYPRPISSLPVSLPEGGREGRGRGRKGREGAAEKGGQEGGGRREGGGGAEGAEGNFT